MSDRISVRAARHDDLPLLVRFNVAMALETEDKRLAPATIGAGIERLLQNAELGRYLIADIHGEACGALMLTREWSDWRNGMFWWIQSVFVEPAQRRRGVYRALHEQVRMLARAEGDVCGIRLYVERDNVDAQRTYTAMGMHETAYRLFEEDL